MPNQELNHPRDGSGRSSRTLQALDPEYVSVDERSITDLLRFATEYARKLRYYNDADEVDGADGNWSNFPGDEGLVEALAYLEDPEGFVWDESRETGPVRPHLALFLTFLKLIQAARSELNELTRRHLEFYYREALRLSSRAGVPDRVHVLVEGAYGQDRFLLPQGTLLKAGTDALGKPLLYRIEDDLIVGRGSVERVKSLFVEKLVVGIHEARLNPDLLIRLFPENQEVIGEGSRSDRAFLAMLMIALGSPVPGSRLEPYPGIGNADTAFFDRLDVLLNFIPSVLYMTFSSFRSLMDLKGLSKAEGEQWAPVNEALLSIARRRSGNPDFRILWAEPANFEKNLLEVLDMKSFDGFFDELPEVRDVYDLYRRREREDVILFMGESLFMTTEDFVSMMELVEGIHNRLRRIYEILRSAGRKKWKAHPEHALLPPEIRRYEEDKFHGLVIRTLGTVDYSSLHSFGIDDFDGLHGAIVELEKYFHMSAENFIRIRSVHRVADDASPWEWRSVYDILEGAYGEKVISDRRRTLRETNEKYGFDRMILSALGGSDGSLPDSRNFADLDPERDKDYLVNTLFLDPANLSYLRGVRDRGKIASADEWNDVYTILELSQRRMRRWKPLPPRIEGWENLYAAPEASKIRVRPSAEGDEGTQSWKTFGRGYAAPDSGEAPTAPGDIGFAIASPILALAEGKRTIALTLSFHTENFDESTVKAALASPSPFRYSLSTEKGMTAVEQAELCLVKAGELPALRIVLRLDDRAPAVVPPTSGAGIPATWPVLALTLADLPETGEGDGRTRKRYGAFRNLTLSKIRLEVAVEDLTGLSLENDDTFLDAKKPFEPFGTLPAAGNSLRFAHPELCSKGLDSLTLTTEWLGVPDDLSAYYVGYSEPSGADPAILPTASPIADNACFKAALRFREDRSFIHKGEMRLFHAEEKDLKKGAAGIHRVEIGNGSLTERETGLAMASEVRNWNRYWQLELLAPDFQHGAYPRAAAVCANKVVKDGDSIRPKPYIVNPPYTPKIKRLTAGYTASIEFDAGDLPGRSEGIYHIEPFGYRDPTAYAPSPCPFLPRFDEEGELYIGIKDLDPPEELCLLFQTAEGSADPNLEREPVRWSYLDGDAWRSLEGGGLLSDGTNGLLNSGILKLKLPAVGKSTLLDPKLYWIRAVIARNCRCVADIVAIHAQAVVAVFEDRENDPGRLAQPLKAESITGLTEPLPEVKSLRQPYSSFGGKSPEEAGAFHTRVSERLRHKNRALTSWDYEHLVLEAFPCVFQAKCLPAGTSEDPDLSDVVQVIVVPDIQGKLPFDPFEPKLPADILMEIEKYLTALAPPFIRLMVRNPGYVRLRVRVSVRLRSESNPGFYTKLLNEELQRFLSPWAYDHGAEIVFGGRINASLIINFLEQLPCVDYVAGINLYTSDDGRHFKLYDRDPDTQLEEVTLLGPESILVSDRSHVIDLITEERYEPEFFTGINYMKTELDFQIG